MQISKVYELLGRTVAEGWKWRVCKYGEIRGYPIKEKKGSYCPLCAVDYINGKNHLYRYNENKVYYNMARKNLNLGYSWVNEFVEQVDNIKRKKIRKRVLSILGLKDISVPKSVGVIDV